MSKRAAHEPKRRAYRITYFSERDAECFVLVNLTEKAVRELLAGGWSVRSVV